MLEVYAYIDGFNLYHGMHSKFGRQFHWLDPARLAAELLRPGQRLAQVKYFTARVRRTNADFANSTNSRRSLRIAPICKS